MRINKRKGIYFFITGFSGSGKSSIAKNQKRFRKHGPTILLHGDELRKIFKLKGYSKNERIKIAYKYSKLCKKITDNKINVILATVSLFSEIRVWNKKNIKNYFEIYIKSDFKKILKRKQKFFYKKKSDNVVGIKIKPELPKNPSIIINNNFTNKINHLSDILLKKIFKLCKK